MPERSYYNILICFFYEYLVFANFWIFNLLWRNRIVKCHILNVNEIYFLLQAGMQAVRENRYIVLAKDFEKGYKNNIKKDETEHEFYK